MEQPVHPSFRPSPGHQPQQQQQQQHHSQQHNPHQQVPPGVQQQMHPHHHTHQLQQHLHHHQQQQQQHHHHHQQQQQQQQQAQHMQGHNNPHLPVQHQHLQHHGHQGQALHPHHPHAQSHQQPPSASPGGSQEGRPGGAAGPPGGAGGPRAAPGMPPGMSPIPMALAQPGFPFHAAFSPAVASQGLSPERLRAAALPPAVLTPAQRMPPPLVPMATAFPGFPELARVPGPAQFPGFMFTQEDLDMTLYGYARNKNNEQVPGHALSGLRIGELSYGIDRILGNGSTSLHPSLKSGSASGPIDPSTLDLPEGIELFQTTFAGAVHYGVFCKKTVIAKGSVFGPFRGKQVNTSEIKTNDDNSFMWEIFQDGKLAHFIDGRGSAGNWMAYVNCARYAQEQNLLAVQTDGEIYYEACKDIPQGTELLVWYGDCYLQFMGIPVALKEMADGMQQEEVENSEGYQCERCGKVFAYRYYRDKHLKYTRCVDQGDRKFPCHLCSRSFEKRDRLRIHILHVHEKHRPHKCTVCGKSFSQSSSLNKHMRVHSGERPYKCVYCSKAFTASSILRTHIRQHSGEKPFKCRHCGKAFASHAAHDSHVRRTHTKDKPCVCTVCGKTFSQAYELKFHMNMHNGDSNQPFSCDRCGQRFQTVAARDRHVGSFECQSADFRAGSADSHVMDLSHDPMFSGRGGQHDINMNVNEKVNEEPIDVVGLDTEELMAV